jgi:hypothetical protein
MQENKELHAYWYLESDKSDKPTYHVCVVPFMITKKTDRSKSSDRFTFAVNASTVAEIAADAS